ncbi:recombination regulator RecX [Idiomarina seosinensis]|uniref:regulatory protein RecX n=1 Tax=Idiomarina seosinensis TaxID=281739 RepID=UPI00384D691D
MDESSTDEVKAVSSSDFQALKESALRLLTRREHSRFELAEKLSRKGWAKADVEPLLDWLAQQGWQSDERFAASFVREKLRQGQGPLKIVAQATQQRGVERQMVDAALQSEAVDWRERCREVQQRKFGEQPPADRKGWAKRVRYLQQRGFGSDDIFAVIGELEN